SVEEFIEKTPKSFLLDTDWRTGANLNILKQKRGQCIFRSEKCQIHSFRPLVCRMFPYSFFSKKNNIILRLHRLSDFCPGLFTGKKISTKELQRIACKILDQYKKPKNATSDC
ncbi:MAG: YkgJ family cysteine cluster protein, partial [Candidatus Hodarchaeota archaeon]